VALAIELEYRVPLLQDFKQWHGISCYGRYRDDIILLSDGVFGNMARELKSLLTKFRLEQWEISQNSLVHLDVVVYKIPGSTVLHHKPYFKPSSLGVPLTTLSQFPPHIHSS
jgi:hypothetical protein